MDRVQAVAMERIAERALEGAGYRRSYMGGWWHGAYVVSAVDLAQRLGFISQTDWCGYLEYLRGI